MVTFPNAKINLGLHVLRRRADGFHEVETALYPVGWTDALEVRPSPEAPTRFRTVGRPIPADGQDNLCLRAYRLLAADYELPAVAIDLLKAVPTGGGLGGGSADAAFVLRALNSLFALGLSAAALRTYAARLGSDCAFFVDNVPALATGRGERLTPLPKLLEGYWVVIVKPDFSVGTAAAYQMVRPTAPAVALAEVLAAPLDTWRSHLKNDFEAPLLAQYPTLRVVKEKLYAAGAVYASLTGSGSCLYGIFSEGPVPSLNFPPTYELWEGACS